jgi:hypothetical protein
MVKTINQYWMYLIASCNQKWNITTEREWVQHYQTPKGRHPQNLKSTNTPLVDLQ